MAGAYDGSGRLRLSRDCSARKHRCRSGAYGAAGAGRETTIRAAAGATAPRSRYASGVGWMMPQASPARPRREVPALARRGRFGHGRQRLRRRGGGHSGVSVRELKRVAPGTWRELERVAERLTAERWAGGDGPHSIRARMRMGRPFLNVRLPSGAFSRIPSQATSRCLAPVGRGRPPPLCVSPPKHRSLLPSSS